MTIKELQTFAEHFGVSLTLAYKGNARYLYRNFQGHGKNKDIHYIQHDLYSKLPMPDEIQGGTREDFVNLLLVWKNFIK